MSDTSSELATTPLYDLHLELAAKMVPFAGYNMPVQYPLGVKKEHLHTREKAGLFDVSHMGQIVLRGPGAAEALERLVPVDIVDLPEGKQRYALFTDPQGGVLDDFMVSNFGDCLYLVVNAACKAQDLAYLQQHLADDVELELLDDRGLIALQGPLAAEIMANLAPETADMVFMDSQRVQINGHECFVSRAGYTGEDGFEISMPAQAAEPMVRSLLSHKAVEMIGLGARDSLRLEAGLCLYGHDLDADTTPIEAGLSWAISKPRRADGARAGGFPGAERIFDQMANKSYARQRVGLVGEGRAPVREATLICDEQGKEIGVVTSGTLGPSAGVPIAMAYLDKQHAALGTLVFAAVRGKQLPMRVSKMPFVAQRYRRS
ncbi:glycine cleavage system aminomethyltransferase GcvT [Parahaliea sp. F7430]|uniref:aminomethyltransferase n=1 Tax=Sediminihaliea albiluteola TaxID=2758564 RepID=A0A7W2TUH1_9GAMM|nr:glycine cleavage system aminomethyltransferase GcvT [Sediminihaliea albiluteola]MBA6412105.1 glycine cleavage system aminomethyltransferase GcvT [Sediminihaliea albiluteola]